MKKPIPILLTLFLTQITCGQTFVFQNNPTFDSVKVVPSNPTSDDSVKFIIYVTDEAEMRAFARDTVSYIKSNDTIYLDVVSYDYIIDTVVNLIYAITLDKLPTGNYTVTLRNYNFRVSPPPTAPPGYIDIVYFEFPIKTSIGDINDKKNIFIQPFTNLFDDNLVITLPMGQIKKIELIDITGNRIYQNQIITCFSDFLSKIEKLTAGVYFIRITTTDNLYFNKKVIKI